MLTLLLVQKYVLIGTKADTRAAQVLAGELPIEHVLLRQVQTDVCSRMQLTYAPHPTVYIDMHTYIHTYMHTCMHTCMHACIHTYMHAYIHTYIHTYTYIYVYILYVDIGR